MPWMPTWTSPITGTSVPKNHNQPIARYGRRQRGMNTATEIRISTHAAVAAVADSFT